MGSFLFWLILPYLIAAFVRAAYREITKFGDSGKNALRLGKDIAHDIRRNLKNE